MLCRSFTHEMRSASIRQRFLLWTTLAVILHGLLYLMLAHALEPLDHLLGWPVWFPLFRSTALTIVPALLVGLLIGYQKRVYKPLVTIPLGVLVYWGYIWRYSKLPWCMTSIFYETRCLAVPGILLSIWISQRGYRLSARHVQDVPDRSHGVTRLVKFRNGWKWPLMILAIVLLFVRIAYYMPFLADDALISLRYAQRLDRGAWVNLDGRPAR